MGISKIKTFEAIPPGQDIAVNGGFQPQSLVQKGYQPQGSTELPAAVPNLLSGVVPPSTSAPPSATPADQAQRKAI